MYIGILTTFKDKNVTTLSYSSFEEAIKNMNKYINDFNQSADDQIQQALIYQNGTHLIASLRIIS